MKILLMILVAVILFMFFRFSLASTTVAIQGGKVMIQGGYVAIGSTQTMAVASTPSGTTGQCIGILCGVTHAN